MAEVAPASEAGPSRRRRDSWNLRTIVEDVAGKPLEDLQEPGRPAHPFLKSAPPPAPPGPRATPEHAGHARLAEPAGSLEAESHEAYDPVARIHPPLVGEVGRSFHGREHEHHAATLAEFDRSADPPVPGTRPHAPGPSRRPERIYLHYLLLHMDRLSDTSLVYLRRAVDEEIQHRQLGRDRETPLGTE
jgi:hypothetical protein